MTIRNSRGEFDALHAILTDGSRSLQGMLRRRMTPEEQTVPELKVSLINQELIMLLSQNADVVKQGRVMARLRQAEVQAEMLRKELEAERSKGLWRRRLFG